MEQKERTYSTKELFRRFCPYYRPYGAVVAKDLACAALTTLAELTLPMIIRYLTNTGMNDLASLTVGTVLRLALLYLTLRLIDTLAAYYAKEERERLGLRSWSYTRNARKPSEDREPVDAHEKPQAPEGTTVLYKYTAETPAGIYYYVKYLLPASPEERRPHAKRRRKLAS